MHRANPEPRKDQPATGAPVCETFACAANIHATNEQTRTCLGRLACKQLQRTSGAQTLVHART
eukprot:8385878-Pyramimonas_sp.AAC.1